ncbi:MAG TPA: DNA-processing protein DprA [Polyangiaceae bacterium]|nr:DNA-processing protein DprA [Polyangiaceae bacterium]
MPANVTETRTLEGAALPPALRELSQPPVRLFARGELPRGPCVAVVGTRDSTLEAVAYARRFAAELAGAGVTVASGGAAGIDAAAHEGALDVGGRSLVVAPSGLDQPYPEHHAELFARVVAGGGAHVSPFVAGAVPRRAQFFLRNAVLVALSQALVVVEAPLQSGARNAAKWARQLGRPVFVVPAVPWNPRGLGCIVELELGAHPIASVAPVLRWLRERGSHAVPLRVAADPQAPALQRPEPAAAGPARAILEAIDAGARHPAEIAQILALSVGEVSHAVLLLTLQGLVRSDSGQVTRVR